MTREVLCFLNGGDLPRDWNKTVIVLIPKVLNPESLKDLRSISLCNVLYKVASKVLAGRLKLILPEIISQNQSAFVPGRLITDNVLVAYELTHFLQNKRSGREGYAALKLDMSKAYDRVEWHFLQGMMERLGFDRRWINLMMQCVSTVSYKIRVNGVLTENINPSRGLRQGDPLSPYLFLICAEGFSSLLNEPERAGHIEGLTICVDAPSITHLLFADDSLLLLKVNDRNAHYLQHVLQLYEECSGQKINMDKSSILFSKNCTSNMKIEFREILNLSQEAKSDKYLGLPVYMGRSRSKFFSYLKDRVWKRIQGWKEKMLSRASKETLIKAIAQAIPSYAMSCFDLTKALCDEISSMICRYWWAQQDNEKKLHWIGWNTLASRKEKGVLGYRDLHLFNLAMLARQCWRLIQAPDSLCARLLKARYFPNGSVWSAKEGPGISYTWRSLIRGMRAIENGIIWRVGDGNQIRIWEDAWIPAGVTRRPRTPRGNIVISKVAELMDPIRGTWDSDLINDLFWEEDACNILAIPVHLDREDSVASHFDRKGVFSVKSAYHALEDEAESKRVRQRGESSSQPLSSRMQMWKKLWKVPGPPKIKQCMWRVAHNSLSHKMNIKSKKISLDTRCPVCLRYDEDGAHCFFKCKEVRKVWREMGLETLTQKLTNCLSATEVIVEILRQRKDICVAVFVLIWKWWSVRNKVNAGELMP